MKQQTQINKIEWREVELKDLIDCVENGNRPKGGVGNLKEGIPSIGGEHINKHGGFNFSSIKFISKEFFDSQRRGIIQKGDVLVVKDGATTGRVTLVSEENFPYNRALVNEHVFILRPKESIIFSKFLFFFLYSIRGQKKILDNFHGSAQGGINTQFVKNVTIPVPFSDGKPDLKEQGRIVSLLEKANKQKERSKKAEELLDEYLKSVFAEMFYGKGFEEKKLEEITNIVVGQSPPGDSYNMKGDGTPFFQGKAEFTEKYPVVKKWTIKPSKMAEPNSILMSVRAPVGDVNLCNVKCCIGRGLASIKLIEEVADLYYVYFLLHSIKDRIEYLGSGSTFKAITSKQLSSIKIPLPPISLQQKFAQIIEHVEKMKEYVRKTKLNAEELFNSLMDKAFRGEL